MSGAMLVSMLEMVQQAEMPFFTQAWRISILSSLFCIFTGRICRRQLCPVCRYCFYSRPGFGVYRPAGATRCTDQGEI